MQFSLDYTNISCNFNIWISEIVQMHILFITNLLTLSNRQETSVFNLYVVGICLLEPEQSIVKHLHYLNEQGEETVDSQYVCLASYSPTRAK